MVTTKTRRRRRPAASAKAETWTERYEAIRDEALADQPPDAVQAIEQTEPVRLRRQRCIALDAAIAEMVTNGEAWAREADEADAALEIDKALSVSSGNGDSLRGRPPKSPERLKLEGKQKHIAELTELAEHDLRVLPGIFLRLAEKHEALTKRLPVAKKHNALVNDIRQAIDTLRELCGKALETEQTYRAIAEAAQPHFLLVEPEIVSLDGLAFGPDSTVEFVLNHVTGVIDSGLDALHVADLHLSGKVTAQEKEERRRSEVATYQKAIQQEGARFRKTAKGQKVWASYRKLVGILNEQSGDPLSRNYRLARQAAAKGLRNWHLAVCDYSQMDVHEQWFPTL